MDVLGELGVFFGGLGLFFVGCGVLWAVSVWDKKRERDS